MMFDSHTQHLHGQPHTSWPCKCCVWLLCCVSSVVLTDLIIYFYWYEVMHNYWSTCMQSKTSPTISWPAAVKELSKTGTVLLYSSDDDIRIPNLTVTLISSLHRSMYQMLEVLHSVP